MSVNDLLVQGAEPLFFLDYLCSGKLEVNDFESIIRGIANACKEAKCALIGGETAEMPGLYEKNKYDMAGFAVGVVEREDILPKRVSEGDIVLGIPSSGFHSNGYSLIRKVIKNLNLSYDSISPFDSSKSLGEVLLEPTKIYVKTCLPLIKNGYVKAMAHITGGGIIENIPRVLPKDLGIEVDAKAFGYPKIMRWLAKEGRISNFEMAKTFNCGIGMVCIIDQNNLENSISMINSLEEEALILGQVVKNDKQKPVVIKNIETWSLF